MADSCAALFTSTPQLRDKNEVVPTLDANAGLFAGWKNCVKEIRSSVDRRLFRVHLVDSLTDVCLGTVL